MKRYTLWFLQATVIIFLGLLTPAPAAGTDQTHLSKLVKTKQQLLIRINQYIDKTLPTTLAKIHAYEGIFADYLARANQLKFLITTCNSNPFEMRMYFKQCRILFNGLERETRSILSLSEEIQANFSGAKNLREDLRSMVQTAPSLEEKQNAQTLLNELDRYESTQLKLRETIQKALQQTDEAAKFLVKSNQALDEAVALTWTAYLTNPMYRVYDENFFFRWRLSFSLWISTIESVLLSKLPYSPVKWGQSAIALLVFSVICHLIFKWFLGRIGARSDGNQDRWVDVYHKTRLSIILCSGFWAAALITVFPEDTIFSKIAVIFSAWAAVVLGWGLRNIQLRSRASSPLYPFFYLFVLGIIAQITNMPLRLLGVFWPLSVSIMMCILRHTVGKYKNPGPRRLTRFCFWFGFPIIGLSLWGFTYPSMIVFLTLFLCFILHQFALALSHLIRRRLARLQEKGDSLFHSISISLGIPMIWFLAAGIIFLWLADQFGFGQSEIRALTHRVQFTWQDIEIGFYQIVAIVALFFVVKPVVAVLEMAVERVARKSHVDQAVMMPVQTVVDYGIWGIYGLLALHIIGVRLNSILVLAGGMSVGIGFGLQHIINNFISGVILLFGRSVRPGDVIEHELVLGEVEKVTIRNTLVRTRDDTTMLIPNSNLVSMPFVNMSRDNRAVRLIVAVGADYSSDPDLVERLLLEAAREHPDVLNHPAPRVRFEDFQDSYLDFRLKFWVDFNGSKRVASDLRFAILKKFREQGVEIAFPQMDLHFKGLNDKSIHGLVDHP